MVLVLTIAASTYPTTAGNNGLGQALSALSLVWISFGAILTLFAFDHDAAARGLVSVAFGLTLGLACVRIMNAEPRMIEWLAQGWVVSFVLTSAIASWEILTLQHLSNYFLDPSTSSTLPAATFFNPNAYALYLVGIQGLLLWKVSRAGGRRGRLSFFFAYLLAFFLLITTGSRLCLVAAMVLLLVFLLLDKIGIGRAVLACFIIGITAWQFLPKLTTLTELVPDDVQATSLSQILQEFDQSDTSAGRRVELSQTAAWLIINSGGLGVGPGNFGAAIDEMHPPYQVGATRAPHNFVAELSSEFGLVVLFAVAAFTASLARRLLSSRGPERAAVLSIVLAFIPASFANSGYLLGSTNWVMFATLLCLVLYAERMGARDHG